MAALMGGGLLLGWPVAGACASETGTGFSQTGAGFSEKGTWAWDLASGFDSYLHSYALATDDTTETLAEFMVQAGLTGQSTWQARHRWRVRAEAGTGTELSRERFEGEYRLVGADRVDRIRVNGSFWGRQYRPTTDYTRSSDNWEGRLEGRVAPLVGRRLKLELRGWHSAIDYRTPSTLEVDYRDTGGGLFVRSTARGNTLWGLGMRLGGRTYPDSTTINRDSWSVEGDLDHQDSAGQGVRLYHKSERRTLGPETTRPSAWTHWSNLHGAVAAGPGHVVLDLQGEIWQYDQETEVYFNSVLVAGAAGYRWGDILTAVWQLALAGERLAAGDSPETYSQLGLRGGVESYGSEVGGSLTLEYGRRVYNQGAVALDPDVADSSVLDTVNLYTSFNYWKIWLMANWQMTDHFDLDLMANYEPENHTEQADDSALGFASVRVRWRP